MIYDYESDYDTISTIDNDETDSSDEILPDILKDKLLIIDDLKLDKTRYETDKTAEKEAFHILEHIEEEDSAEPISEYFPLAHPIAKSIIKKTKEKKTETIIPDSELLDRIVSAIEARNSHEFLRLVSNRTFKHEVLTQLAEQLVTFKMNYAIRKSLEWCLMDKVFMFLSKNAKSYLLAMDSDEVVSDVVDSYLESRKKRKTNFFMEDYQSVRMIISGSINNFIINPNSLPYTKQDVHNLQEYLNKHISKDTFELTRTSIKGLCQSWLESVNSRKIPAVIKTSPT